MASCSITVRRMKTGEKRYVVRYRSGGGTLGAVTVDNLRVPQNATCRLNGTFAKGTIKVERSGTLVARGVRVVGNVQGENASNVVVRESSRVGGSVQVKQGGAAAMLSSRITGDIQYDANRRYLKANGLPPGGTRPASAPHLLRRPT